MKALGDGKKGDGAEKGAVSDRFDAISVLFLRVLQRDSTEAPKVVVSPAKGAQWVAAVFIGEPPKELLTHYQRGAVGEAMTRAPTLSEAFRIATGSSGEGALIALELGLRDALKARLLADLSAWERATGRTFGTVIGDGIASDPLIVKAE